MGPRQGLELGAGSSQVRAGAPQAPQWVARTFPSRTTVRSSGRSAQETVLKVPAARRQRLML